MLLILKEVGNSSSNFLPGGTLVETGHRHTFAVDKKFGSEVPGDFPREDIEQPPVQRVRFFQNNLNPGEELDVGALHLGHYELLYLRLWPRLLTAELVARKTQDCQAL